MTSFVFCGVAWELSVHISSWLPVILVWPGIVAVDAVCARLGFYESGSASVLPWFIPGLLLDVMMYTVGFCVIGLAWRMLSKLRRGP